MPSLIPVSPDPRRILAGSSPDHVRITSESRSNVLSEGSLDQSAEAPLSVIVCIDCLFQLFLRKIRPGGIGEIKL